ncbi:MAG: hypothetical protein EAX90_05180 [Candidatus Heimdallarchaeota archaeon]|nr:hypothetical protein [Candidatus Heimdallarchaeota archaeon]
MDSVTFPTKDEDKKEEKILNESEIANVLIHHLTNLGYQTKTEFVLNNSYFNIKQLTNKEISKVRIDVAAVKDDKIIFIEVENGLWITHPLIYRNFAHRVLLAYPAENENPTDDEQIKLAKSEGIGIIKVSAIGSITPLVKPLDYDIPTSLCNAIISLFKEKTK